VSPALLTAAMIALAPGVPHASSVTVETIHGQRAVVATPEQPTRKVVVISHGAGRDAVSMLNDIPGISRALLDRGYTLVTSDAHGDAWGNRASREDYVAIARTMRRRGLDQVYMLARSMGGLASLAAIPEIRPLAWAGIYPACNLRSLERFRHSIARAWRMPWPRIARLRAFSPIQPRAVRGLPMIFWASPADRMVSKRRNTDRCAAAAGEAGAQVTVVTTRGDHGDRSNMDPPRLAAFFDAA
jgi:pimeloyl-ACP methyl ester carboxylesterase